MLVRSLFTISLYFIVHLSRCGGMVDTGDLKSPAHSPGVLVRVQSAVPSPFLSMKKSPIPARVPICLRIASVLYFLFAAGFVIGSTLMPKGQASVDELFVMTLTTTIIAVTSLCIIAFNEVVLHYLRKGAFWSWVAGVIVFGLYIPSIFLPLGVIGLTGLMNPAVRKHVGA